MQIKIFTIPLGLACEAEGEFNKFLSSHKIIDVQQIFCAEKGCWTFCVRYLNNNEPIATPQSVKSQKVDYKELLDNAEFEKFSKLRMMRKRLASEENLPAYAVFTDAELCEISKLKEVSMSNLKSIKGLGSRKLDTYGKYVIETLIPDNEAER